MNAMEGLIAALKESVQEHENTQAWLYRKAREKSRSLQDLINRSNEAIARATEPKGTLLKSEAQVKVLRKALAWYADSNNYHLSQYNVMCSARHMCDPSPRIELDDGERAQKAFTSTGTDHLKKELKYVNRFLELVTDMERSVHSPRCSHCATDFTESELHQDSCPIGRMRAILEKRKAGLEGALNREVSNNEIDMVTQPVDSITKFFKSKEVTGCDIMLPRFERIDSIVPVIPESSYEWFDLLKTLDDEILKGMGLQHRGKGHYLFPHEWYAFIPEDYPVVTILNKTVFFKRGKTSDDKRLGMLAYGFKRS